MDRLRAVLVGCGGISKTWLNAIKDMPDIEIAGLVDVVEEAARARADEYALRNALIGSDLPSMLDHVKPDVVFDCTIPEAHVTVTLEALKRGCHVLGEKPLADTLDNARQMVAAAEASGKIYAVIQNRRYDRNIRTVKQVLDSGAIGPITTINSDFYIGAHFGGFRDHMAHVLLLDMAIHTFDAARFLTGADPISVYCKEWNPPGSWYDCDASAIAIFELSGDIVYSYRGGWSAEGLQTTWESDWRIIGQQGSLKWDGAEGIRAQKVAGTGTFLSQFEDLTIAPAEFPDQLKGHAGVIRDFVNGVRTGKPPQTICTDNIKSLAMVFGAVESARTGQPVQIAPTSSPGF